MTRRIGVLTVARSDYGIYRSLLDRLRADYEIQLGLYVGAAHLSPDFGMTVDEITAMGDPIVARIEMLLAGDSPEAMAKAMGLGMIGFAQAYAAHKPDMLVALGDRFEMHAAVTAALPFNIPVAHIHGGELSFGAIDDSMRHSITKLSHLHFAATEEYAARIVAMGEEPWRVHVSGAPALDKIDALETPTLLEISQKFGISFDPAPLLVTFHPVTREQEKARVQAKALCDALARIDRRCIFTMPNADTGGRAVREVVTRFAATRDTVHLVENFGFLNYFGALRGVAAMVGNSSSALIEAPSFGLPAVNIGYRQDGRTRAANIIDVTPDARAIEAGIRRALTPEFRKAASGPNPYGDGTASEKILRILKDIPLDDRLIAKRFHDA